MVAHDDGPKTRRRGAELETAILDAAWDELAAVGYARLTMEAVALRAQTGKQVLYRRWPNRAELVLATMRHRFGSIAERIPRTGRLRDDVLTMLRHMAQRQRDFGPDIIHGLMSEVHEVNPEFPAIMGGVMRAILEQAAERGEVRLDAISPRVAALPMDLVRHEIIRSRDPIPDSTLVEIVDDIFLPLLRVHAADE